MDESILPYDILRFDYKERLQDRFLTTHIHRFDSFKRPVAIAIVVEILNPWHPTSEIGQAIINNIIRDFSRSDGQSFLARFENSLLKINKTIAEASKQLETEISAVAILLEENQIHCAGIGQAKLGLYRNGKLATIIGSKDEVNSFIAVTSGDLYPNDWLMITNADFYHQLSVNNPIFNQPIISIEETITMNKGDNADQFWAGLLLRFNSESIPENRTIFWGEPTKSKSLALPQFNWRPNFSATSITKFITATGSKLLSLFRQPPQFSAVTKRWWQIGLISLVGILLFSAGVGYYRHRHKPVTASADKSTLLTEITALPAQSKLSGLVEKFQLNSYQQLNDGDKQQLATSLTSQKISLVNLPSPEFTTPNPVAAVDNFNGTPILIDNTGQVWLYKNQSLNKLAQKQLIPSPLSLATFSETNIVVSDATGNIWHLTGSNDSPTALTLPKIIPTSPKLVASYQTNLYIAAKDSKTSFRANNFTANLSNTTTYLKGESLPLTSISDLAIGSTVLAVDSSGKVVNFTKAKLGSIATTMPVNDGPFLITIDKTGNIAIGSGRLIYLLDPTGAIQKILFLTSDQKITDLVFDTTNTSIIWFSIESNLYKLSLS